MRGRTAAGLVVLSLFAVPLAGACAPDSSIEVTRRRDVDSPRTTQTDDTEPPSTTDPDATPPTTEPPTTTETTAVRPTLPTLTLPPPPIPGGSTLPTTPVSSPDTSAPTTPAGTDPPAPSGAMPPAEKLLSLVPLAPPGDIDLDKTTASGAEVPGLYILKLVVNNGDFNPVAAYYEAEFPTLGWTVNFANNDGTIWTASLSNGLADALVFVQLSQEFSGFTEVLITFTPPA